MDKIVEKKQTSHVLKISIINFFFIMYPTNCIPIVTFLYFPLSMQCFKVFCLFIPFIRNNFFLH